VNFDLFSFDPHITAAIQAVGHSKPTPIQRQAMPIVLQGRDVLGPAQTGTGKTAAFILPILPAADQRPIATGGRHLPGIECGDFRPGSPPHAGSANQLPPTQRQYNCRRFRLSAAGRKLRMRA